MSSIRELDDREFEFRDSTDEVLDYWHTLRVTNTHSDKTRAHGLDFVINNNLEEEELVEEANDYLDVHDQTVEDWIDLYEEEGLIEASEDNRTGYEPTVKGRVMEKGLKRYSSWIADNHPVTDEELREASLDGIFDKFNIRASADEVNVEEFIEALKTTDHLNVTLENTVDMRSSYDEAIQVMNELEGDRMEILGLFLQRPEEEAMQAVEDGNYCIKTGQGAKTYIKRMQDEREIVEKTENGYQLNDKGKKAIETLKFQSQMMEYGRQSENIGHFVNNLKNTNFVQEYADIIREA